MKVTTFGWKGFWKLFDFESKEIVMPLSQMLRDLYFMRDLGSEVCICILSLFRKKFEALTSKHLKYIIKRWCPLWFLMWSFEAKIGFLFFEKSEKLIKIHYWSSKSRLNHSFYKKFGQRFGIVAFQEFKIFSSIVRY